jgi:nucleoside diphosphate kinase
MNWFKIENRKEEIIDEETAKNHYAEKKEHPLFNDVVKYISSDVSIILSISWNNAILEVRNIALKMRKKYIWESKLYNLIHSSDSLHESNREHDIHFW